MINLLPPEEKKKIERERKWKLALNLEILFLIFSLFFFFVLLSIKIYLQGETQSQEILISQREKELKESQLEILEKEIEEKNETIKRLFQFYQAQIVLSEIFERISQILPKEIYLTSFSFSKRKTPEKKYFGEISLSGFSPTRQALISLKENLEKEKDFQEIYFPPQNWLFPSEIEFNLNFKIK